MSVRTLILAILCVLGLLSSGVWGARNESMELDLSGVPACGMKCLDSAAVASQCSLDDWNCVCRNRNLAKVQSACMLDVCSMQETLDTSRVQAGLCDWSEESKKVEFFIYSGVVYSLAFIFVALRIAGKVVSSRLSWDDAVVAGALALTAVPLGCVLAMTRIGFGEHLWNLEDGMLLPILRFFAIAWSTYTVVLGILKISLLMFYLEIFQSRTFRITAYVILGLIVVNTTIICLLTTFACNPVQSFWDRDLHGKCMDVTALAVANSASAIIQDCVLLILPLFFIKNLNMRKNRKVAIGFMFCVGSFGCIATIIRLQILVQFKISIDPTWDYVSVTIWTELELAAVFLCVSLPSIRILLVRMLPRGVREWFYSITHSTRSWSSGRKQKTPPPLETPQSGWKKPSSWGFAEVSVGPEEIENTQKSRRRSFFAGLWTPASPLWSRVTGTGFSTQIGGTRRLPSIASNMVGTGAANTRPPTRERVINEDEHISVELTNVSSPHRSKSTDRRSCKSCGDSGDEVTALPSLGCLPERSYSDLDLTRHFRGTNQKRSNTDGQDMC